MRGYFTGVLQLIPGARHSRQALCNILSELPLEMVRTAGGTIVWLSNTHYWKSHVTKIVQLVHGASRGGLTGS